MIMEFYALNFVFQVIAIGCGSFALVFAVLFVRNFIKISHDEALLKMAKHDATLTRLVKVSQISDATYLMHDAQTHEFMCQAVTVEDLWACAKVKFPNINLIVDESE